MTRELIALAQLWRRIETYCVHFVIDPIVMDEPTRRTDDMIRLDFDTRNFSTLAALEERVYRWLIVTPERSYVIFARSQLERDYWIAKAKIQAPYQKVQTPQPAVVQELFEREAA